VRREPRLRRREPLGLTNCLNFGNPEKPHVAWQLTESVRGLGDACRALGVPVVGGNVSLYNEGPDGPIYPTPVVGHGRRAARRRARRAPRVSRRGRPDRAGRRVRARDPRLGARAPGRHRAAARAARDRHRARRRDPARDPRRRAIGALSSAHDIAEGGLATALAECCLAGGEYVKQGRPRSPASASRSSARRVSGASGRWPRFTDRLGRREPAASSATPRLVRRPVPTRRSMCRRV
jgi:phosphoribosylformylglycinamidine (FGAM) synthase-like enzyme